METAEKVAAETETEAGDVKIVDLRLSASDEPKGVRFWKAFTVTYVEPGGEVRQGNFVCKRLTLGEVSQVGVRTAQLDGGLENVPLPIHIQNAMIAHLESALLKKPDWFVPTDLYDVGLLTAVYAEVSKFESSFRRPVGGRR